MDLFQLVWYKSHQWPSQPSTIKIPMFDGFSLDLFNSNGPKTGWQWKHLFVGFSMYFLMPLWGPRSHRNSLWFLFMAVPVICLGYKTIGFRPSTVMNVWIAVHTPEPGPSSSRCFLMVTGGCHEMSWIHGPTRTWDAKRKMETKTWMKVNSCREPKSQSIYCNHSLQSRSVYETGNSQSTEEATF